MHEVYVADSIPFSYTSTSLYSLDIYHVTIDGGQRTMIWADCHASMGIKAMGFSGSPLFI